MLLLAFIENAFKHGANKNVGKIEINIDFNIVGNFLYFKVSNPIPTKVNHNVINDKQGGIGIGNVKKRLELGYNKEDYKLEINNNGNEYVVDLKIKV